MDLHRGPPDLLDAGVDAQHVANLDRSDKGHGLDGDGHDASLRALHGGDAAGLVHLAQHPAAENVAIGVGVGGHGDEANGKIAMRLVVGCFAQAG